MLFSAWGIVEETRYRDRLYLGHFLSADSARQRVRDALGSGCYYGWVMRGNEVLEYVSLETRRFRQRLERSDQLQPPNERKRLPYEAPLRLKYGR